MKTNLLAIAMACCLWMVGCAECPPAPSVLPAPGEVAQWVNAGQLDRLTDGAVTFLQVADAHLTIPASPGWGSQEELVGAMREMAATYPKATLLVATGDNMIYSAAGREVWDRLVREAPYPVRMVNGNVDPWPDWLYPDGVPKSVPRVGKFQAGDNLFLFMDSSLTLRWHEGVMDKAQLVWLNRELSAVKDRNVFLIFHHPPVERGSDRFATCLANSEEFMRILRLHRPRQRAMVLVNGHSHFSAYYHRDLFDEFTASSLMDGRYRVFHVSRDRLITYERWSTAWNKLRKEPLKLDEIVADEPVVLRFVPNRNRPALAAQEAGQIEKDLSWPGFDAYPKGDVLKLDFSDASGWIVRDRSGQGNDVWDDGVFWFAEMRGQEQVSPWLAGEKVPGVSRRGNVVNFGHPYVPPRGGDTWEMVAFDCLSLNSPAITNRLTLEAEVMAPEQPLSRDYVLVGKGSYELTLNGDGRPGLRLLVNAPAAPMKEVAVSGRTPITAGTWHKLVGTFDGQAVRLYVDGAPAGEVACPRASLRASEGAVVVGARTHLKPGMTERALYVATVRISNQCDLPGKSR